MRRSLSCEKVVFATLSLIAFSEHVNDHEKHPLKWMDRRSPRIPARSLRYIARMINGTDNKCLATARLVLGGVIVASTLLGACTAGGGDEFSILRGDEAAARGDLDAALAEYRLAVTRGPDDASALARVAHTYAEMGRIDEAGDFYHQAVEHDPGFADQAVSDMVRLARAARDRDDLFGLASAMETAMSFRPGITMQDMELPLARHYFRSGEYATALPYYQASIAGGKGDLIPDVVFEAAKAYDEVGDCRRALYHYEDYRALISRYQRLEVNWKIGSCSLRLAVELRSVGEDEEALAHIERTIALGEPRSDQARAYFVKGEILFDLGRCEDAMDAFLQVRRVDQTGVSPLVGRAQWRYDELRFQEPAGGGLGEGC